MARDRFRPSNANVDAVWLSYSMKGSVCGGDGVYDKGCHGNILHRLQVSMVLYVPIATSTHSTSCYLSPKRFGC